MRNFVFWETRVRILVVEFWLRALSPSESFFDDFWARFMVLKIIIWFGLRETHAERSNVRNNRRKSNGSFSGGTFWSRKVASTLTLFNQSARSREKIRNFDLFQRKKYRMNIPDNYDDALSKVIWMFRPGLRPEISRPEIWALTFRTLLDFWSSVGKC